jgi:hypothetical protein
MVWCVEQSIQLLTRRTTLPQIPQVSLRNDASSYRYKGSGHQPALLHQLTFGSVYGRSGGSIGCGARDVNRSYRECLTILGFDRDRSLTVAAR